MQVGRDPRLSGPVLAPAMAAGMAAQGAHVARFGPATTPAMFMSCVLDGVRSHSAPLLCSIQQIISHAMTTAMCNMIRRSTRRWAPASMSPTAHTPQNIEHLYQIIHSCM